MSENSYPYMIVNGALLAVSAILHLVGLSTYIFYLLAFAMVLDFFAGLGASYAHKEPITFLRMQIGFLAKFSTLMLVILFAGLLVSMQSFFQIPDFFPNLVLCFFASSEMYSVCLNIKKIKSASNEDKKRYDAISLICFSLAAFMRNMIEKFLLVLKKDEK